MTRTILIIILIGLCMHQQSKLNSQSIALDNAWVAVHSAADVCEIKSQEVEQ